MGDSELSQQEIQPQSSLPLQSDDEHQAFQGSVSPKASQHQPDELKAIPRSLSFGWLSLAADAISILVTIPFIILGFLLAKAKGEIVERNVIHNLENGIRVVSISDIST